MPIRVDPESLESVESDLRTIFAVPVPALTFTPAADGRGTPWRTLGRSPRRRAGAVLGLAAALIVTIAVLPAVGGFGASTVNAQELIQRTSQATGVVTAVARAYHLVSTATRGASRVRTETWLSAAGARTESTTSGVTADETFGLATYGSELWIYRVRAGRTLVAHVASSDRRDLVGVPSSLAEALASYTIPGCQVAAIVRESVVAGRSAYIVEVRPTPASCVTDPARPETAKVVAGISQMGSATIAIDKATEVTLALEQLDVSGAVAYSYQVDVFETGDAAARAGLPYVAPVGATVVEVADYGAAKSVFAGQVIIGDGP